MSKMTLFVDASWCPQTKAGGVGAWCKKDGWDRGYALGSQLERGTQSSTEAELLGIVQALEFLDKHSEFDGVVYLMIQCDCLMALHALIKWGGFEAAATKHPADSHVIENALQSHPKHRELAQRAAHACRSAHIKVVRHVKGHREGDTSRSWVNEQCDALAKQHMRKARAEAYGRAGMGNKRLRASHQSGRVGTQA